MCRSGPRSSGRCRAPSRAARTSAATTSPPAAPAADPTVLWWQHASGLWHDIRSAASAAAVLRRTGPTCSSEQLRRRLASARRLPLACVCCQWRITTLLPAGPQCVVQHKYMMHASSFAGMPFAARMRCVSQQHAEWAVLVSRPKWRSTVVFMCACSLFAPPQCNNMP